MTRAARGRLAVLGVTVGVIAAALGALIVMAVRDDTAAARRNLDAHVVRADLVPVVIENHEGFPNLVVFCDGATRIYTSAQYPPVFVTDDPECGGTGERSVVGPRG